MLLVDGLLRRDHFGSKQFSIKTFPYHTSHADLAAVDWSVPNSLARAPIDRHLLGRGMQVPFKNCPARLKYSLLLFCHRRAPQTSEPFWEAGGQGDCEGRKPNCTTTEQVDIAQKEAGHAGERFDHEHPMIA